MSDKSAFISYWAQAAGLTYGIFTMEFIVGCIAIFLGIATYVTTYYFKKREDKRALRDVARKEEIHTLQVLALKRDAE